jgi:large subunit ribosomal protein L25
MAEKIVVEGSPREKRGKNEARRLRLTGKVPAVLYGGKGDAITLAVNTKQVVSILRSESGHNTLFQVDLAGKHEPAILKDWLVDPVSGNLLHVDLLRVAMDVRMKVKVPVHTFGEPSGVKVQGGVFEVVTREVEIECLPGEIPTEFRMDVSGLMLNQQMRASERQEGSGRRRSRRGGSSQAQGGKDREEEVSVEENHAAHCRTWESRSGVSVDAA